MHSKDHLYDQFFNKELVHIFLEAISKIFEKDKLRKDTNSIITENNIFQVAIKDYREEIRSITKACLKEGSSIIHLEHWDEFHKNFKQGKSSLILAEHKSNLDVICFYYLMRQADRLKEFDDISFIAGRKLNEESNTVRIFAEMFNRLVVVPKSETQGASEDELHEIYKINYAAQQFLKKNINEYIYLIYPTGTRSRLWEPDTYKGITETVNYLEKFDQVIFMSCDGNCMIPLPGIPMDKEPLVRDTIKIQFSKPYDVKEFIKEQKAIFEKKNPAGSRQELKIFITDSITQHIYSQKSVPPTEEKWNDIVRTFLEKNKFS